MINPISTNTYPANLQSQAIGATQSKAVQGANTVKPATVQLKADTVTISTTAQALSLYQQGLTLDQIAIQLGVDIETVRRYLGLPSTQGAKTGTQPTNNFNDLMQAIYKPGVGTNTIKNYFEIPTRQGETPALQTPQYSVTPQAGQ